MKSEIDPIRMWHRGLRDWPSGACTPRLKGLLVRDCRAAGGLCACSAGGSHALVMAAA